MLRVDPRQRQRLIEIIRSLAGRIDEAKASGWHGEVRGLTVSLHAAENKIAGLDRAMGRRPSPTLLGLSGMPAQSGQEKNSSDRKEAERSTRKPSVPQSSPTGSGPDQ